MVDLTRGGEDLDGVAIHGMMSIHNPRLTHHLRFQDDDHADLVLGLCMHRSACGVAVAHEITHARSTPVAHLLRRMVSMVAPRDGATPAGSGGDRHRLMRPEEGTMWRTASGILSGVSFHGYRLTCAFGARCTVSIATAYGCPGTSSGNTRIGVWQARTNSRARYTRSRAGPGTC